MPERIAGRFSKKPADPTVSAGIRNMTIELTVICNLRCTMCWWWGEKGIVFDMLKNKDSMVTQELKTDEIKRLVDQVAHLKPSFYLAGGEPFLRKDTVDIIEYINSKKLPTILTNNGTMLSEEAMQRLAKVDRLTMNFSIDGPRDVHDRIRGQGNYDRTMNTVKRLVELRGRRVNPSIKTNTTFSPWIVGRIDELIRDLQAYGIDAARFQHLWFTDEQTAENHRLALKELYGIEDRGARTHVISTPTQKYVEALAKEIADVEKRRYNIPVFMHPKLTEEQVVKYYTDLTFSKSDHCSAPWTHALVKANGDVMFCPDEWVTQYKIGNVREGNVVEMWNNEKARFFRQQLNKVQLFPACKRCCAMSD